MNNNSWVKLYRKINLNSIMADPVALQLFIWVLTNVDTKTGETDFGRFIVAKQLKVNPSTLYSALKRLVVKYKVCEISSTAEYTTIRLLNWAKYQPTKEAVNTSDINETSTNHQPVNTLQELRIKNKEIIYKPVVTSKTGLIPCSEDELLQVSSELKIPRAQVVNTHQIILNKIEAGEFKNKTVYYTLKNWLIMGMQRGTINAKGDGYVRV